MKMPENNEIESQVQIPKAVEELPSWAKSLISELRNENAERRISQKELKSENERLHLERTELTTYKTKYDSLKLSQSEQEAKLNDYTTKYSQLEERVRTGLLEKLPTTIRDKYASLDIAILQTVVEDLGTSAPPHSVGSERASADTIPSTHSELMGMTNEQQQAFKDSHPEDYHKLLKQIIGI